MLSALFGKKPDHPLADIKFAQAMLSDLPRNDPHKSLTELAGWLELLPGSDGFKLDHQLAVLRLLDEAARPCARKLAYDYFTPQELNTFHENRLWLALSNYAQQSAKSYLAIFDRYCAGDKNGAAIKAQVPLLAARAVHAMTDQLKYNCAHRSVIDSSIWNDLALLCQHAEQYQYLDTPLGLYPGMVGETSVKYEIAHLLGWYGCGVDTLDPLHMHFTERIARQYCDSVDIGAQQNANSLFSFDMSQPAPPMRVKAAVSASTSTRFISMAAMQPKLEALIKTLKKNIVPEELYLGSAYKAEWVCEAAQHLLDYLIAPPSRRSTRRAIKTYLNVVKGFDNVAEHARAVPDDGGETAARWELDNISARGFRAVLPTQGMASLRIGNLLGIQPVGMQHWGVAVVRRMTRSDANLLQVGAEILANQVAGVTLGQSGDREYEDAQPALWLIAKQEDVSGEALLLMNADAFSLRRSFQTRLNGKTYLLIPIGLQEKGLDFDLAKFRVVEQESGAE